MPVTPPGQFHHEIDIAATVDHRVAIAQLAAFHGLRDVSLIASHENATAVFDACVCGQRDRRRFRSLVPRFFGAEPANEFEAVCARHPDVRNNHVERLFSEGGESLFQNTFTATQAGQTIWLAPAPEGDIVNLDMNGQHEIMLNSGAYLASAPSVNLDTKWGGKALFWGGEGGFTVRCTGTG